MKSIYHGSNPQKHNTGNDGIVDLSGSGIERKETIENDERLETEEYLREYLDFLKQDHTAIEGLANRLVKVVIAQELAFGKLGREQLIKL